MERNTPELILRAQSGDEAARAELVDMNIALIKSVVRGFLNRGCEYDDLFQTGSIGLIKAIDRFDVTKGVRFSTYAVPMIAGEIKRFLRDDGAIKVSRSIKEDAVRLFRAQERLKAQLGREPTLSELSADTGIPREELSMTIEASRPPASLDAPAMTGDGRETTVGDSIGVSDDALLERIHIRELIASLDDRERRLIALRFFRDKTQSEIARELGVSQVQVSRLLTKVLGKLRSMDGE